MNKLVELRDISAGYEGKEVLKNVSFDIWEDDFLGIIGPNGGGKTTLLKVILGLLPCREGCVRFFKGGAEASSLKIGYLPQVNYIDKKFPISVWDVIASGLSSEKPLFKGYNKQQKERIKEVLHLIGLDGMDTCPIGDLSGGQLQRVLLGRSIVSRPQLLILDEPASYVDKKFESRFNRLLEEMNRESAVILVSHDIGTVLSLVKNIVCVNEHTHYHPGSDISAEWLGNAYACPVEILGHGDLPHRVVKIHKHD